MSEFEVGDYVVYKDVAHEHGIFPTSLFEVTRKIKKWGYLEITETKCWHHNRKRWGSYGDDIRHATPEEIAASHRIDKPSNSRELETLDEPAGSLQELHPEFAKVFHENFLELLGDDFPIENRISLNCKVTEAHINEADKLNRLG
ncbi:TPA: hypothetical protein OUA44_003746 [Acinetobacter baumannii]|nr:hypothetical protein [Acinetobacter baumannii]